MNRTARLVAAASIASIPALAWSNGIDVVVGNGDKVTGSIAPATETETFHVNCPRGASVRVKAKAAKGGPALHVVLRGPSGALAEASGPAPKFPATETTASGALSVDVSSEDGSTTGDYALQVTWKSASSFPVAVTLPPGGDATASFAADAGAQVTVKVKAARGSQAVPVAQRIDGPQGFTQVLSAAKSARVTLPTTGDYTLVVHDGGAAGGAAAGAVKLSAPKAAKHKVDLTAKLIGSGDAKGDRAFGDVVGIAGGTVSVPPAGAGDPGAAISGAAVSVPSGALTTATPLVIGTAPLLTVQGKVGAGPSVFFGPQGLAFQAAATVTIPFVASYATRTAQIEVYVRDAAAKVSLVPGPYTFDAVAHTVRFSATHFSVYRAMAPSGGGGLPSPMRTAASVPDPRDVCQDQRTGMSTGFFIAEGADGVGRINILSPNFGHVHYAGGTVSSSDGTPRLDFQFPEPAVSVHAAFHPLLGDVLFVATRHQIFRIDHVQGTVTRFAGDGQDSDRGDGGNPLLASFMDIRDILASAPDELYVVDAGAHKIRHISGNVVQTYAGTGTGAPGADGVHPTLTTFVGPYAITRANISGFYVADGTRVRHLDTQAAVVGFRNVTLAGHVTTTGTSGDGGVATGALLRLSQGVSIDFYAATGNDYCAVLDKDAHTLRRIDVTTGGTATIDLVAGTPDQAGFDGAQSNLPGHLSGPTQLIAFGGYYFVCDPGNGRVVYIDIGH